MEELQQQVLEKLGIADLPKEEQDEVLALTLDAIIKQAVLISYDTLPEDKKDSFASLVENGGSLVELVDYFSQTVEGKPILTKAIEDVLAEIA